MKEKQITENQKKTLIEFLKKNENLQSGKFSNTFSFKDARVKWMELTDILNAMPGVSRDWKDWRKTWQDTKARTKQKASQSKNYACGTGGGPHKPENDFTEEEQSILEIIKPVSFEGHRGVQESEATFSLNTEDENILLVIEETDEAVTNKQKLETMSSNSSKKIDIKKDQAQKPKLSYTAKAAENLRVDLAAKTQLKEQYYERKLQVLERIALAQERSADAKEQSCEAKIRAAVALELNSTKIK